MYRLITLAICTVVLWSSVFAADRVEPYVSKKELYVPQPVQPLPENTVGIVSLPLYGGSEIDIYKGSEGSGSWHRRYYYKPYLALSSDELRDIYKRHCSNPDEDRERFYIDFHLEIGSREVARKAAEQLTNDGQKTNETAIGILEYSLVELIDTYRESVVWRFPRNTDTLIPTTRTFSWAKVRSASTVNCEALHDFAFLHDALAARAVIPSAVTSRSVGKLQISTFRDHLLSVTLHQDARAKGALEQIAVTTVRGESKNSGAILAFTLGSTSSGSTSTTVSSTETDRRERWVDREAYREATNSYAQRVLISTWCEQGDSRCDKDKLQDKLFGLFESYLEKEEVIVVTNLSAIQDNAKSYIYIDDPGKVERLREASMNPSFASSLNANVDCKLLEEAAGASTGGTSDQIPTPDSGPSDTSPEQCGLSSNTTVSDKNNIKWRYIGKEWIPVNIELSYVSADSFSGAEDGVILETTYSGATAPIYSIPLVIVDEPMGKLWTDSAIKRENCYEWRTAHIGGGKPGKRVTVVPWRLQFRMRFGSIIDLMINNPLANGDPESFSDALTLSAGEYIDGMAIWEEPPNRINRIAFRTNYGDRLAAGRKQGERRDFRSMRVLTIGARGERWLEGIDVAYCRLIR